MQSFVFIRVGAEDGSMTLLWGRGWQWCVEAMQASGHRERGVCLGASCSSFSHMTVARLTVLILRSKPQYAKRQKSED